MTKPDLPAFKYHPDAVSTESLVESDSRCVVCDQTRGYSYDGPSYGINEVDGALCPWCIADGSAASRLDLSFTDGEGSAGIAASIVDELVHRTPGYTAWQQEYWEYHCGDACAFIGRIGIAELEALPPAATDAVRASLREWAHDDAKRDELFGYLHKDGNLTGYLFRCCHCDAFLAHCDNS